LIFLFIGLPLVVAALFIMGFGLKAA